MYVLTTDPERRSARFRVSQGASTMHALRVSHPRAARSAMLPMFVQSRTFFPHGLQRQQRRCSRNLRMSSTTETKSFRLAPSDFAFLWEECKRCFYLKAHKKLFRPRAPFPTIFGAIDLSMKKHLRGLPTQQLLPQMRKGTFLCEDNDAWVECTPFTPPGRDTSIYIRGMVS